MKYLPKALSLWLITLLAGSLIYGAPREIGKITFILGAAKDVQLKRAAEKDWQDAKMKAAIFTGDDLKTLMESRCEVKLSDGSVVRIGENTVFHFTQANIDAKQRNVKAEIERGKIYVNLARPKSTKNSFQIKTPTAVCAVRGTIYRIDADSTTDCLVYDGQVEVGPTKLWGKPLPRVGKSLEPFEVPGPDQVPGPYEVSLEQWIQIVKGFRVKIRADGKYAKSRFNENLDNQLEWVRWNKQLDEKIKRE